MKKPYEDSWQQSYHEYLTRKLDQGSKNIVVDVVTELLLTRFNKSDKPIRVADIGCYTGSIINRIYLNLPKDIRKNTIFVGLDKDSGIIELASRERPHISFIQYNLTKKPPQIKPFQIIILSNVLHELYSEKLPNKEIGKLLVVKALHNIGRFLSPDGYLILLDGVLPDKLNQLIKIKFLSKEELNRFINFAKSDYIIPVSYKKIKDNISQTTVGNLAAFLTKARYLKEDYWHNEAKQVYQYFTIDEFRKTLSSAGIEIETIILQSVPQAERKLRILTSNVEIPPKNILIKARKVS